MKTHIFYNRKVGKEDFNTPFSILPEDEVRLLEFLIGNNIPFVRPEGRIVFNK